MNSNIQIAEEECFHDIYDRLLHTENSLSYHFIMLKLSYKNEEILGAKFTHVAFSNKEWINWCLVNSKKEWINIDKVTLDTGTDFSLSLKQLTLDV